MRSFTGAKVMQAGRGCEEGKLGPALCDDEGFQDAAEKVAVGEYIVLGHAEDAVEQAGVDEVALGAERESFEAIAGPCGKPINDEQVLQQRVVGARGVFCDARCVPQGGVVNDSCAVERDCVEVGAQTMRVATRRN